MRSEELRTKYHRLST